MLSPVLDSPGVSCVHHVGGSRCDGVQGGEVPSVRCWSGKHLLTVVVVMVPESVVGGKWWFRNFLSCILIVLSRSQSDCTGEDIVRLYFEDMVRLYWCGYGKIYI